MGMTRQADRHGRQTGFTLVELMIVVAIIGILASIAVPNYQRYVLQSRRGVGQAYMLQLALAQEKLRATCSFYAKIIATSVGPPFICSTAALTTVNFAPNHPDGYYTLTISSADSFSNLYTISAAATTLGGQDTDAVNGTFCTPLTLTEAGVKGPAGCWKK